MINQILPITIFEVKGVQVVSMFEIYNNITKHAITRRFNDWAINRVKRHGLVKPECMKVQRFGKTNAFDFLLSIHAACQVICKEKPRSRAYQTLEALYNEGLISEEWLYGFTEERLMSIEFKVRYSNVKHKLTPPSIKSGRKANIAKVSQSKSSNPLSVFEYNGKPVTFKDIDGVLMVSATEMAKAFGKRPVDFLRLPQIENFIQVLNVRLSHNKNFAVKTVRGRYNAGTWMHERLALKFAAWLSPEFELWVYDHIDNLLKTGKTELKPETKATQNRMQEQNKVASIVEVGQPNLFPVIEAMLAQTKSIYMDVQQLKSDVEKIKEDTTGDYVTISGFCRRRGTNGISSAKRQQLGRISSRICKDRGLEKREVKSVEHGFIGAYPYEVVREAYGELYAADFI